MEEHTELGNLIFMTPVCTHICVRFFFFSTNSRAWKREVGRLCLYRDSCCSLGLAGLGIVEGEYVSGHCKARRVYQQWEVELKLFTWRNKSEKTGKEGG